MRRRTAVVLTALVLVIAGLIAGAVVAFPHGTIERATGRPAPLPPQLEGSLFELCATTPEAAAAGASIDELAGTGSMVMSTSGSGSSFSVRVEAVDRWRVDVDRHGATLQSEVGDRLIAAPLTQAPSTVSFGEHLYRCMSPYHFDATSEVLSSSELLQLYRYDRTVLWPCLTAHGVDPGPPPQLSQFASAVTVRSIDPFGGAVPTRAQFERVVRAATACPLTPDYLH